MLLEFGIVLCFAVVAHLCWFVGFIHSNIVVPVIDFLLLVLMIYIYFKQRKREKEVVYRKQAPSQHFVSTHHQDFYISRWKRLHLGNDRGKLPLNRLAYLKARYRIGPFMRYRYAHELSSSFFRGLAEKPPKTNRNRNDPQDECHPRAFVTEFTDKYLQYRALLYYAQETENVDFVYQVTSAQDLSKNSTEEQNIAADSRKNSTIASRILDERFIIPSDIAPGFDETEDAKRKRQEFEEQLEVSKKKLEDVQGVFHIIKQGKQLNHTIRDERQTCESEAEAFNLRKIFTFSRSRKKDSDFDK